MSSKLVGGTLLVVGTTIGAGMLALPIATAQLGFVGSIGLLLTCWAIMTACAFLFLEVNLLLPPNSNLVSMAGATLGRTGQAVTWIVYLVLLYTILSAYIAGGGDLFHYLLTTSGIQVSLPTASVLFTFLFGLVVYFGIRSVDYVNRGLMFGKLGALILLIILMVPFVSSPHLLDGSFKYFTSTASITTTATAFGCIMIIPSLRTYFDGDVKMLRKAIFIGTLIPLICYIGWDMVIMGIIPLEGTPGLKAILQSSSSNSDLISAISVILHKNVVTTLAKFFTSICMATSFLSVSLSLSDFLADGFNLRKQGFINNAVIFGLTYLPPLIVVLFYPDAFLRGIQYAGICCFILMILLPALMAWRGRLLSHLPSNGYEIRGGKFLLALLILFAIGLLGVSGPVGKVALALLFVTLMIGLRLEDVKARA